MSNEVTYDNLIASLERSRDAHELLELIWNELGPYNNVLSQETTQKLQKYFEFDDSE